MMSTDHLDNAAGYIILPTTRICLVHGMELSTTALNLGHVNQYNLRRKYTHVFLVWIIRNVLNIL